MAYESTTFEPNAETTADLKARAQETVQRAKQHSAEKLEDTVDLVRRHPGKAVAITMLVGGILGALIVKAVAEEETNWDKISDLSAEAWEKLKDGALDAISAARDVFDSALSRRR